MTNFLKGKLFRELSVFLAVLLFIAICYFILSFITPNVGVKIDHKNITTATPIKDKGVNANYSSGASSEIDFLSSIARKNQLTLMGSSEFNDSPFCSYHFIPESIGYAALGIGHAYHQNFSILCELLAGNKYLDSSKIVLFLSPGWFETEGTNSEAFLEFVPSNFLEKIWMDNSISKEYKIEIGHFIAKQKDNFSQLSFRMQSYINLYEAEKKGVVSKRIRIALENQFPQLTSGTQLDYHLSTTIQTNKPKNYPFYSAQKKARKKFIEKSKNNSIFVDSAYYNTYLANETGSFTKASIDQLNIESNQEFKDFLLILKLVEEKNIDFSVIVQGLNPYYYQNLSNLNPIIRETINRLEKANIPYLNLFTDNTDNYEPGTLNDVMHLGDVGWLKVNEFLYKTYIK